MKSTTVTIRRKTLKKLKGIKETNDFKSYDKIINTFLEYHILLDQNRKAKKALKNRYDKGYIDYNSYIILKNLL